jgi:hypothetical protein
MSPSSWTEDDVPPALLFIAFAGLGLCMPPHNDTWWHLRAGLEMVKTGGILATESFSHTAYGTPLYHNHEWLSQLVFYGLYRMGGPLLLAAVGSACALGAVAGSWRMVEGSAEARLGWLMLLFVGTVSEWAIRPQVISLALFVLAIRLATSERGRDRWLPLLCLVWANLHAVAIVGVLIAACAAAESVLWSRAHVRRSLLILAGCVAAPLLTPLGWHYWPRVFQVVRLARALEIHEYRSALELAKLPFWVVVAAFAAILLRQRGQFLASAANVANVDRKTRILVLIAALFAVAGALSVRNIPMFILAGVPAMSRLLCASKTASAASTPRRVKPPKPAPAAAAIFVTVVFAVAAIGVAYAWRERGAHLGWAPISTPAIESIRRCDGPLFNGFADGGILTWWVPERRVFVDSRGVEAYPLALLLRSRDADLFGDYDRLFKEFAINCAVVEHGSIMAQRLSADRSMREQYSDPQWVVFTRRAAQAR